MKTVFFALVCCVGACAAENAPPTALFVGGQSAAATLLVADAGGFQFATDSGERAVAPDELVRWGHPVEATTGRLVVLVDGSRIAADPWIAAPDARPLVFDGTQLSFASSTLEGLTVPRHVVRGIVLQVPTDARQRDELFRQVDGYEGAQDAALLVGGDRLTGRVAEIKDDALFLEGSLGPVQAPLSGVLAICFDPPPPERARARAVRTLVGLEDGSLLVASEIVPANGAGRARVRFGSIAGIVGIGEIVFVQPLGGHVAYLSDVEPHRFEHVPYLDLEWPLGRDHNVLGGRLRAGGRLFAKGLGVHSEARIVYRLDGSRARFSSAVAIDDSARGGGSAVFRVLLAEGNAWRVAHTSEVIRGGDAPVPISVPLGDAKGLALVVDYADRGDELDHADWLDARLE
jgi:hypothetical protein